MGLHATIYYNQQYRGCALMGISERFESVTIVNADGPFKPSDDAPAVLLRTRKVGSHVSVHAVPCDSEGKVASVWYMMGGSFIHTSDSRFREAIEKLTGSSFYGAVALHDRVER